MRDDRNDCPTYVPRILGMCHMGYCRHCKGLGNSKVAPYFLGVSAVKVWEYLL